MGHNNETTIPVDVSTMLSLIKPEIGRILDLALQGDDVSEEDAAKLLDTKDLEYLATCAVADHLRRLTNGNLVTYVVNRNINFTNVCIKRCGFCAFSRDFRQEEGYFLPMNEIIRRAKEAMEYGATEVCIQAGLPPQMEGDLYIQLCSQLKSELPELHIHGFSPEEVLYGSIRSKTSIKEYLEALLEAGVGSLPGTSAEILDQTLRDVISPGRIPVETWVEVITTAHRLGIPTTSTVMFGHVESHLQITNHIGLIRSIQKETGGFTEFVPLSFVHAEAPMFVNKINGGVKQGPTSMDVMKVHAVSRIMLNNWIPNIQASWVKEGNKMCQMLLNAGVNDLGGTLINESISTSAGSSYGQLMRPAEFKNMIRDAGRIPAERLTNYQLKSVDMGVDIGVTKLDEIGDNVEQVFGSYDQLVSDDQYRFSHPSRKTAEVE
jgi:FO synthase subunit 2